MTEKKIKNGKILIDTGAWVDFLTSKEGEVGSLVALAIELNQAVLCGVVIAELLQGAHGEKQQQQLNFLFSNIESLPMTESVMLSAGQLLQNLRTTGVSIPLTDAVIAAVAQEQSVPILTIDENFKHFESIELVYCGK